MQRSYGRVSDLPVEIEALELRGHESRVDDWVRRTTEIRLSGDGHTGAGEDVVWDADEQLTYQARGPELEEALRGTRTLADLSRRLDGIPLFVAPPDRDDHRLYRRWGLESAALDLALRQTGRSLGEILGLSPRPVRFVASRTLAGPEDMDPLRRLLDARPEVDLKLDAVSGWTDGMISELADSGRVGVIDFKGAYVGTPVDTELDLALYRRVLDAFPETLIEDPHRDPSCLELLEPHRARVSWDAPLHSIQDIDEFPWRPEVLNIKPSRFGFLESLLDTYDHCRREGIDTYGGGQHELGVGRGQIQALAALFHPDAPNDVAPREYNADLDPAQLPGSPLPVPEQRAGLG